MPDIVVDVVLGLVQGLTEFLPVSSSGHLVVVPAVLGWDEPSVSFDLLLHVATLLAVLVYFRSDVRDLVLGIFDRGDDPPAARRLGGLILVGTIPAAVAGLALANSFEALFEEPFWVCGFWLVTAVWLLWGERVHRHRMGTATPEPDRGTRITVTMALLIGSAQALALAPGISRSGATIVAGMALGLSRRDAARFAFLLAIPAIGGGGLTLIPDIADGSLQITGTVVAGFAAAALAGYVAVAGLLRMVATRTLVPFAVYLVVAAPAAALVLAFD